VSEAGWRTLPNTAKFEKFFMDSANKLRAKRNSGTLRAFDWVVSIELGRGVSRRGYFMQLNMRNQNVELMIRNATHGLHEALACSELPEDKDRETFRRGKLRLETHLANHRRRGVVLK